MAKWTRLTQISSVRGTVKELVRACTRVCVLKRKKNQPEESVCRKIQ